MFFASAEAAVQAGKQDLLAVLRSGQRISLGVDAATVERASAGSSVERVDVDFERLLAADDKAGLKPLVKSSRTTVVPLVAAQAVVTIVELQRGSQGWRIVGLADQRLSAELAAIGLATDPARKLTLYEIPNIQARVYSIDDDADPRLFTNYGDRFNLKESVSAEQLLAVLKADALAFQREHGEALKQQKLVR